LRECQKGNADVLAAENAFERILERREAQTHDCARNQSARIERRRWLMTKMERATTVAPPGIEMMLAGAGRGV
jgi:hypothetical protein